MNGSSPAQLGPARPGNQTTLGVILICILVILACFVIREVLKKEEPSKEKELTGKE
jgi:hypothetical protein